MKFLTLIVLLVISTSAALSGPMTEAAKNGENSLIDQLVREGADVNEIDIAAPLHWAALYGHDETVQLLLSLGADPSTKVKMLGTPLHAVIRFGEIRVLKALLAAGVDPNVRDHADLTPLMVAARENRLDAAQALISVHADVNAVGKSSKSSEAGFGHISALHIARFRGLSELDELLVAGGARPHPIESPAKLMDAADWMRGYYIARAECGQCHIVERGEPRSLQAKAGPSLIGILGQEVAADEGFDYSDALRAFGGKWTRDRLYSFSRRPKLIAPGTKMDGSNQVTQQMIADVVKYFEISDVVGAIPELPMCPVFGSGVEKKVDCVCVPPIGRGPLVNVKGSGPYANQSHVCLSAVHAGAIGRDGGAIRVVPRPPQSSYVGSTANGVYSSSRGRSKLASFDVEPSRSHTRDH